MNDDKCKRINEYVSGNTVNASVNASVSIWSVPAKASKHKLFCTDDRFTVYCA